MFTKERVITLLHIIFIVFSLYLWTDAINLTMHLADESNDPFWELHMFGMYGSYMMAIIFSLMSTVYWKWMIKDF